MKKITIILFLFSSIVSSQEIVKNEIDEFNGNSVIETSWISLQRSYYYSYTRFRKINDTYYLDYKVSNNGKVFSVDENNEFLLKFSNKDILTLFNISYTLTNIGEGSTGLVGSKMMGIYLHFVVSEDQMKTLINNKIVKTRLHTSEGYMDEEVKNKFYIKFKKQAELILNSTVKK